MAEDHLSVISQWERHYEKAEISERDLYLTRAVIKPRLERIFDQMACNK